jgi:hypothetical protein
LASDVERRMARLQELNASYVADIVGCVKAAAAASGAEKNENKERP